MTLSITYLPIDSLVPYRTNPRKIERALPALVQSLLTFGWRIPLVVDRNRVLVCGHARLAAARKIVREHPDRAEEFANVPVIVADDLDEAQIRAFRLVDNKLAELASWDFDLLAQEIAELPSFDFETFGWRKEELDCLVSVAEAEDAPVVQAVTAEARRDDSVEIRIGKIRFRVDAEDFRRWYDGLLSAHGRDPRAVADAVADRLGLLDAKRRRTPP